jgi:hypothetical protein
MQPCWLLSMNTEYIGGVELKPSAGKKAKAPLEK